MLRRGGAFLAVALVMLPGARACAIPRIKAWELPEKGAAAPSNREGW